MRATVSVSLVVTLFFMSYARAQVFIGISGDFGNRASYSPFPSALRNPVSPSGSLNFLVQENIHDALYLQYGAGVGVLGYTIYAAEVDTFLNSPDFWGDHYPNYETTYVNGHLAIGWRFPIGKKHFILFAGGGVTRYLNTFYTSLSQGSTVVGPNLNEPVFELKYAPSDEKIKGFAEVSLQTMLIRRLLVGLQYRHHYAPAARATYQFYHTPTPLAGNVTVTQRALSILFLVRLGKKIAPGDEVRL